VDCSWAKGEKTSSIAGILRDSRGVLVDGFAQEIHVASPLHAEALALLQGLIFLKQNTGTHMGEVQGWERERSKSDNFMLVEALLGQTKAPWAVRSLIDESK